jgi:hypothetical protein
MPILVGRFFPMWLFAGSLCVFVCQVEFSGMVVRTRDEQACGERLRRV